MGVWGLRKFSVVVAAVAAVAVPAGGVSASAGTVAGGVVRAAGGRLAAGKADVSVPGTRLWAKRFSAPGLSDDRPAAVAVSPSGGTVYVTGSTEYPDATGSMPASFIGTVAYSAASGKRLWVQSFLGPGNASFGNAIGVSPDGSKVYVTGQAGTEIATVAYNAATGHYLWSRLSADPLGTATATALAVSHDGGELFVSGGASGPTGTTNLDTVAYDAVSGALLWTRRVPASPAGSIIVSPDDSAVFVVSGTGGGSSSFTTVSYAAATGHQRWASSFPGPAFPAMCRLAGSPDGTKVFTSCDAPGAKFLTVGYDAANGKQLWQALYQHDSLPTVPSDVAATNSQVFVTGGSNGHIVTVAYGSGAGHQQWASLYPKPGGTSAAGFAIAVSPQGSTVYAVGSANSAFAIAACDTATGAVRWARQWHGVFGGGAMAVAVSPSGDRVFLAGVTGLPAGDDSFSTAYGTVAYSS